MNKKNPKQCCSMPIDLHARDCPEWEKILENNKLIDETVRDLCSVEARVKSRTREILKKFQEEMIKKLPKKIYAMNDYDDGYNACLEEVRKLLIG